MRNILNISLPLDMVRDIKRDAANGQFASISEYIRHLVRTDRLYRELEEDRREFKAGRYKVLRSFDDLAQ